MDARQQGAITRDRAEEAVTACPVIGFDAQPGDGVPVAAIDACVLNAEAAHPAAYRHPVRRQRPQRVVFRPGQFLQVDIRHLQGVEVSLSRARRHPVPVHIAGKACEVFRRAYQAELLTVDLRGQDAVLPGHVAVGHRHYQAVFLDGHVVDVFVSAFQHAAALRRIPQFSAVGEPGTDEEFAAHVLRGQQGFVGHSVARGGGGTTVRGDGLRLQLIPSGRDMGCQCPGLGVDVRY